MSKRLTLYYISKIPDIFVYCYLKVHLNYNSKKKFVKFPNKEGKNNCVNTIRKKLFSFFLFNFN